MAFKGKILILQTTGLFLDALTRVFGTQTGAVSNGDFESANLTVWKVNPIGSDVLFLQFDAVADSTTTFTVEFQGSVPAINTKVALEEKSCMALTNLARHSVWNITP